MPACLPTLESVVTNLVVLLCGRSTPQVSYKDETNTSSTPRNMKADKAAMMRSASPAQRDTPVPAAGSTSNSDPHYLYLCALCPKEQRPIRGPVRLRLCEEGESVNFCPSCYQEKVPAAEHRFFEQIGNFGRSETSAPLFSFFGWPPVTPTPSVQLPQGGHSFFGSMLDWLIKPSAETELPAPSPHEATGYGQVMTRCALLVEQLRTTRCAT